MPQWKFPQNERGRARPKACKEVQNGESTKFPTRWAANKEPRGRCPVTWQTCANGVPRSSIRQLMSDPHKHPSWVLQCTSSTQAPLLRSVGQPSGHQVVGPGLVCQKFLSRAHYGAFLAQVPETKGGSQWLAARSARAGGEPAHRTLWVRSIWKGGVHSSTLKGKSRPPRSHRRKCHFSRLQPMRWYQLRVMVIVLC